MRASVGVGVGPVRVSQALPGAGLVKGMFGLSVVGGAIGAMVGGLAAGLVTLMVETLLAILYGFAVGAWILVGYLRYLATRPKQPKRPRQPRVKAQVRVVPRSQIPGVTR